MGTFKYFVSDNASAQIMSLKCMWSENHLDSLPYRSMFMHVSIVIV